VALQYQRNSIGIEKDKKYIELIKKRLEREANSKLFKEAKLTFE
jgi:DNA modification methylase